MFDQATSINQPPEGGIFLPKFFTEPTDLQDFSEFYWQQYAHKLPEAAGCLMLGTILVEDFPPGYKPSNEISRLSEKIASVTIDARFFMQNQVAWEITLADDHGVRDELYLSTLMCVSSIAQYDAQGLRRQHRYLDILEIEQYTEWLGTLLTSDCAMDYLAETRNKSFPKSLPFNKPPLPQMDQEPMAPPERKPLRTNHGYSYGSEIAIDMRAVFKLIESLSECRILSDQAKVTLDGIMPEVWQEVGVIHRRIRETGVWDKMRASEAWRWLVVIEQAKEQAYRYEDAVSTITQAGERCAQLLHERMSAGWHVIEKTQYLIFSDQKNRSWFCRLDADGESLVFFNRWGAIPPSEGRAAWLDDYIDLLVDTQFDAHFGSGEELIS